MSRTWTVIGLAALLFARAPVSEAQIIDAGGSGRSAGAPKAWTSLFAGWTRHQGMCDPESDACWGFGSALQWRGSIEIPTGRGASLGIVGTRSRMPLIYNGGPLGNSCVNCDADADVSQILGQFRLGGGSGVHQVVDITAGASLFSNFRSTSGAKLGPGGTVTNWGFGLAYGLALPLSPRAQVVLLQEYGLVIGKRVPGQSSNTAQHTTLRIGGRFGLGG